MENEGEILYEIINEMENDYKSLVDSHQKPATTAAMSSIFRIFDAEVGGFYGFPRGKRALWNPGYLTDFWILLLHQSTRAATDEVQRDIAHYTDRLSELIGA